MNHINVPTNPNDQDKIKKVIKELVNSMVREAAEKEYQKEAIAELSDEFQIDKKHFKRMARETYKDEFETKSAEFEDYTTLYETIMK